MVLLLNILHYNIILIKISLSNSILTILCQQLELGCIVYGIYSCLLSYIFGLIYQAFIVPLFDYCDVVWIPCLDKQFKAKEHICSARLGNLAGCVTGFRLRNGIPGYAIGRLDGIPESSPVRLLNRPTKC